MRLPRHLRYRPRTHIHCVPRHNLLPRLLLLLHVLLLLARLHRPLLLELLLLRNRLLLLELLLMLLLLLQELVARGHRVLRGRPNADAERIALVQPGRARSREAAVGPGWATGRATDRRAHPRMEHLLLGKRPLQIRAVRLDKLDRLLVDAAGREVGHREVRHLDELLHLGGRAGLYLLGLHSLFHHLRGVPAVEEVEVVLIYILQRLCRSRATLRRLRLSPRELHEPHPATDDGPQVLLVNLGKNKIRKNKNRKKKKHTAFSPPSLIISQCS